MEVFHEVLQSVRSSRKQLSDRTVKILKEVNINFVFPNRLHIFNVCQNTHNEYNFKANKRVHYYLKKNLIKKTKHFNRVKSLMIMFTFSEN